MGEFRELDRRSLQWDLIRQFADDPRISRLARTLMNDDPDFLVVAATAAQSATELQNDVLRLSSSVATAIRGTVSNRLQHGAGDDETSLSLLAEYRHERDAAVRTEMAIAYFTRVKAAT